MLYVILYCSVVFVVLTVFMLAVTVLYLILMHPILASAPKYFFQSSLYQYLPVSLISAPTVSESTHGRKGNDRIKVRLAVKAPLDNRGCYPLSLQQSRRRPRPQVQSLIETTLRSCWKTISSTSAQGCHRPLSLQRQYAPFRVPSTQSQVGIVDATCYS